MIMLGNGTGAGLGEGVQREVGDLCGAFGGLQNGWQKRALSDPRPRSAHLELAHVTDPPCDAQQVV